MDTAQWPREIGLGNTPMVELLPPTTTTATTAAADMPPAALEKRARPQKEQALNCPRCNSTNTKFCYYNNYSLTQPRYFCKTCRRYWTEGGSLRNVPVGGGSRKNKRSSSSSSSSSSSLTNTTPVSAKPTPPLTPKLIHEGQDLNLAYPHHGSLPEFADFHNKDPSTRRLGPFMQMQMPVYSSGFGMHEFRPPTINFPLDGLNGGGGYGGLHGVQESDGRLLFPFEDLKHADSSNNTEFDQQNRGQGEQNGFWNGMINGGGGPW